MIPKYNIWSKELGVYVTDLFVENLSYPNYFLNDIFQNPNLVFLLFTGKLDIYGQEIYEGDILHDKDGNNYIVYWDENVCGLSMQFVKKANELFNFELPTVIDDDIIKELGIFVKTRYNKDTVLPRVYNEI